MNFKYSLILLMIICSGFVFSQLNPKTNWGSVSEEEINFKEVPYEKEADAVILYESGELLVASRNWGNKIYKRIKILSEKGKDIANYDLFYFTLMDIESVLNLRAQTINFENGKKVITAVKTKEIYDLPYSGYYRTKRFAFPNVKIGSIIELEYNLVNTFHYYMEGWEFQHEIPTLYSSFSVNVLAPVDYIPILHGQRIVEEAKESINRKEHKNSWTLKNLPSLDQPKFLYNPRDYEERIDFQLRGYHHKNGSYVNEVVKWTDINRIFKADFQKIYDEKVSETLSKRILNDSNPSIQLNYVLEYFHKNFKWNGNTTVIPRNSLSEIDQSKKGSSSELNLLLHYVLMEKGIKSNLVLISNRANRKVQTEYPYLNQFRSIINLISLKDGNNILVDASQMPDFGFQFMPIRNFNHIGLIVNTEKEEFISMAPPLSEQHITETYFFDEEKINVKQIEKKSGYFNDEEISAEYKTQTALDASLSEISKSPYVNLENNYFSSKTQFQSEDTQSSFYSFRNPLEPVLKKFIFNESQRNKSIEFDFPVYYKLLISSKIPDGYSVQIPADFNSQRKMGAQNLLYYQNAEIQNGNLVISIEFLIQKIIFSEKEYAEIKSFFDQVNLEATKTILMKKN